MRDKEWLKRNIRDLRTEESENYPHNLLVDRDEVLCLIGQLEEPQKPVVPQFVADWYEKRKGNLDDELSIFVYEMGSYDDDGELTDFERWFIDNENTILTLSDMRYGYEVEKEKLYQIVMSHSQEILAYWKEKDEWEFMDRAAIQGNSEWKFQFTEEEIKALDERFWQFAEPVEEEAE